MKKVLALLMSLALVAGTLAACGNSASEAPAAGTDETVDVAANDNDTDAGTNADAGEDADTDAAEPAGDSDLGVALLVPGLLGDKSFFDQSNEAMQLVESTLGVNTKVVEMGTDATKWEPTFLDYVEDDSYELIVTIGDDIIDVLMEVADLYPDQKFINIDSSNEIDLPDNVYVMVSKMGEMSFLAGLAGALKAGEMDSDVIGFIGGMDIPGINEFLIGYIDGAQAINPDIKIMTSYVGDFTDPSKGKELALIMYNDASVIYQAAGGSGLGVFEAAKEFNEKGEERYAIGVDSDQAMTLKESDPDAAALIITSAIKNIPQYTANAVARYIDGDIAFGTRDYLGLKEDGVTIAQNEFYEANLSAESRATIDDIWQKVIDGEITPINTIGMSTEEVESMRDSVRP